MGPVIRYNGDFATEIVWQQEDWCKQLPKWWIDNCGCKKTCHLNKGLGNTLFDMNPTTVKHLFRYGFVVIHGWVLRLKDKHTYEVTIYPWPKKMYMNLGKWMGGKHVKSGHIQGRR